MSTGIYFLLQSILFALLLGVVYFNKKRIDNFENGLYAIMIVILIIELLLELTLDLLMPKYDQMSGLIEMTAKLYCSTIIWWITSLSLYISTITLQMKKLFNLQPVTTKSYIAVSSFFTALIFLLPIEFYYSDTLYYAFGKSVNIDYVATSIYFVFGFLCLLINIKNIKDKRFLPLLAFLILGGICGYAQINNPGLLLSTAVHTLITFLMYFTIENPDMQMVEELNKNRKLTEQSYNEKSNFLFKISQDLKQPLSQIEQESMRIFEITKEEPQMLAESINNNAKQLTTYVNKALDISNMDIKNLKVISGPYSPKNTFDEICLRTKNELKNKNIEFRTSIPQLPETLIGDSVKIKQIVLSIIFDSIKHTSEGFVELNVNTIIKYGVCRLIIEISDSGCGMNLEKINTILATTGELTKEELERINKLNISLLLVNKMIKSINGNFIIKSEPNVGTTFNIIIDQKIEKQNLSLTEKKLEEYTKKVLNDKKILIVSIDTDIINKIKHDIDTIDVSLYMNDCLDKIKQKEKYKCILIDDVLKDGSGLDLLKQLKMQKKYKTPTLVMIKENQEFMIEEYLKDGFDDYIIKENIEETIKKISKYL